MTPRLGAGLGDRERRFSGKVAAWLTDRLGARDGGAPELVDLRANPRS
jgi:hypothetical protein